MLPPLTPDLLNYRVNTLMFSFQAVGLDFAGPLHVLLVIFMFWLGLHQKTCQLPKKLN